MVALRIQEAKRRMAQMLNEIMAVGLNGTKNGLPRSAASKMPKFGFPVTDLTNNKSFQDKCYELWKDGVLSYATMLDAHGFNYEEEKERKEQETKEEVQTKVFVKPGVDPDATESNQTSGNTDTTEEKQIGRPRMEEDERVSDESKSQTGAQPKPSNPEGSVPQEE